MSNANHIDGWALYIMTFKVGRGLVEFQRFAPSDEYAAEDAQRVAADWDGRRAAVVSVVRA